MAFSHYPAGGGTMVSNNIYEESLFKAEAIMQQKGSIILGSASFDGAEMFLLICLNGSREPARYGHCAGWSHPKTTSVTSD